MVPSEQGRLQKIRELNDALRTTFQGGVVQMTRGVKELHTSLVPLVLHEVRMFTAFTPDNDPHGEHDFGNFEIEGRRFFWKIDYYDKTMQHGSEDPANPDMTTRVLTIMLAEEY